MAGILDPSTVPFVLWGARLLPILWLEESLGIQEPPLLPVGSAEAGVQD
jgi:hypothetical protein